MWNILCLMSLQFELFKNDTSAVKKLCVDIDCSIKSFTGKWNIKCNDNTLKNDYIYNQTILDVYGITNDNGYYSVIINNTEYYIKKSCIDNMTEISKMSIQVPITKFVVLESISNLMSHNENNNYSSIKSSNDKTYNFMSENERKKIVEKLHDISKYTKYQYKIIMKEIFHKYYMYLFDIYINFTQLLNDYYNNFRFNKFTIYQLYTTVITCIIFKILLNKLSTCYFTIKSDSIIKLLQDRIQILQQNESIFKDKIEQFNIKEKDLDNHHKNIQDLTDKIDQINSENVVLKSQINQLNTINLEQSLKIDEYLDKLSSYTDINDEFLRLKEQNEQLNNDNITLKSTIKDISSQNEQLSSSYNETQQYLNNFINFFLTDPIPINSSFHQSLVSLQNMTKQQISDAIFNINNKLTNSDDIQNHNQQLHDLTQQNTQLQVDIQNLHNQIEEFNKIIEKYQSDKIQNDFELRTIKDLHQEMELKLHEKYSIEKMRVTELEREIQNLHIDGTLIPDFRKQIDDLKDHINSLESQIKSMKEDHSIQINQEFIKFRKLSRELEKTISEKANYRSRLLSLLGEKQDLENNKPDDNDSNIALKRSSTPSSSFTSESSAKVSGFKRTSSINNHQPPPPPPPPPMFPFNPPMNSFQYQNPDSHQFNRPYSNSFDQAVYSPYHFNNVNNINGLRFERSRHDYLPRNP